MAIPFVGILKYFSTIEDYQQIQLTKDYRLERTRHRGMSMTRTFIYEKAGILEKNIYRTAYSDIIKNTINSDSTELYYDDNEHVSI
jgi:hypothetical protein